MFPEDIMPMTRKEQLIAAIERSNEAIIEQLWQTLQTLPQNASPTPLKQLFQETQALPQIQNLNETEIQQEIDTYRAETV
jgi:hypothetical protein